MAASLRILFFLFCTPMLWAQTADEKFLTGKIMVDQMAVEKVNILNSDTGKATVSDASGFFRIPVKVGDAVVFSAVNLETKRIVINQTNLTSEPLVVRMSVRMTNLKEITVNENTAITAENLGIIPRGQKKYTPAERRFNEATTGGGIVPLNPILNAISGRTSMLKKEIQAEKKERLLLQLDGWFEEEYYVNTLHINKDYINGFHYFLIEDADFVRALKAKNKTLTKFLVKDLAMRYIDSIAIQQK